jgi:tetratricopeptide (TPR) repeat protein
MEFLGRRYFYTLVACLGLALAGCVPSDQGAADDEKEPHYILGQNRVNAMDYQGAVEAFEQSLEANPHSAAAHFQLAMLYDEKVSDPAAAIYHYQEYLKYNPQAGNADIVKLRITACKQELAADVMQLPSSPAAQRQLQELADKNRQLQDEVDKWRAYYASQQAAKTNWSVAAVNQSDNLENSGSPAHQRPAVTDERQPARPVASPRLHKIARGETLAAIARQSNISLNAILAANPGLDPKKLRVGQVVNVPSP